MNIECAQKGLDVGIQSLFARHGITFNKSQSTNVLPGTSA